MRFLLICSIILIANVDLPPSGRRLHFKLVDRMLDLEPDLSNRYNNGLMPPPNLAGEALRLQRPAWQPTAIEADTAQKRVALGLVILTLLVFACLLLALGWRP